MKKYKQFILFALVGLFVCGAVPAQADTNIDSNVNIDSILPEGLRSSIATERLQTAFKPALVSACTVNVYIEVNGREVFSHSYTCLPGITCKDCIALHN